MKLIAMGARVTTADIHSGVLLFCGVLSVLRRLNSVLMLSSVGCERLNHAALGECSVKGESDRIGKARKLCLDSTRRHPRCSLLSRILHQEPTPFFLLCIVAMTLRRMSKFAVVKTGAGRLILLLKIDHTPRFHVLTAAGSAAGM
jgi:hypothetical protein